ncbi:Sec-independent protein translocase protein TatB [Sphingomonas cannabina]|uniref:Sec-independent protein translocase protein TatB n=1 Tax=Sphingomonas cannabina TaxID=2899123 RepID=UPI001F315D03|nr:Sec-independent protein translocase protein TatB [Sphingomonas cannabina]UIJ47015.1 Sec-independent protein translocase protein TatB [Sphingomonas cannabina]
MFDIAPSEFLLVAIVALLVIGPKDLPKAMRFAGYWVGRARGVARQFRSGFDAMVREAELAEMEKKWAEENARIMREHPLDSTTPALPAPVEPEATPADETTEPMLTPKPEITTEPSPEAPELPLGEPHKTLP